jgi:hypothetical protein
MTFLEAVDATKHGFKVALPYWKPGIYLAYNWRAEIPHVYRHNERETNIPYLLGGTEVGENWVIVE